MSLLLEALRKAERDRDRGGAAPDFDAIIQRAQGESLAQLQRWRWIAGAAVLVAVIAALGGLLLMTQRADTPAPTVTPPVASPVLAPTPAAVATPRVVNAEVQSLDDMTPSRAPPPLPEAPALDDIPLQVEDMARSPTPALPAAESVPEPEASPAAVPEPVAEPPTVQRIVLDPAPTPPVPTLQAMPPAYRADFPPLKVDVHVWNQDPAQRFVLVNGKRYREGEVLREGPQLIEIADNGLLLSHRGERVLLPLDR